MKMEGIIMIGAFGATMIGLGIAENMGVKVNSDILKIIMECIKFGGLIYIIKLVATLFL